MTSILVIDDDRTICFFLQNIIQAEGYDCELAFNTSEAKAMLERSFFELITLDIRMPGESGLDFLGYAREKYPETAVIMISVIDDPQTAKKALENGAYGYIPKPFERDEVIINIHSALRRRELEVDNRNYQYRAS